jgi:hypothetical protein
MRHSNERARVAIQDLPSDAAQTRKAGPARAALSAALARRLLLTDAG